MKHLETIFSLLFTASLASMVVLILLLLIRNFFHKYLNPKVVYILWFLVLIKLLVPFAPQSAFSLFNLLPQSTPVEWISTQKSTLPNPSSKANSNKLISESSSNLAEEPASIAAPLPPSDQLFESDRDGLQWRTIVALLWFAGVLFLSAYYLFSWLVFRRRIDDSVKLNNEEVLSVLEACKEKLSIRKSIPIYETSRLRSPCLYGLIKPVIYLPRDIVTIADSRQLTHILLHELVHYKRKDLWFNSLWMLCTAMHWYNPIVWLAMNKMKTDLEVACDAAVLEVLDEREAASYGKTLLMLSRLFVRGGSSQVNLSHFFNNKHEMKRRITMISKFKNGSYKLSAAAILLLLTLSIILLTNASNSGKSSASAEKFTEKIPSFKHNEYFRWFNSLDRALDFQKFSLKVPDYLPEGYELNGVHLNTNFTKANKADLIDMATITFVSNFGKKNERRIEVTASRGKGNLLEHNQLLGAPYSNYEKAETAEYRERAVKFDNVKGTLFTDTRRNKQRVETGQSFLWQDKDLSYAINYYSEHLSQKELAKMVKSFTLPQQVQHVRYDGERNSFPLYDEKDLLAAKSVLGFKVKILKGFNGTELSLMELILLRGNNQNTGFSFKQTEDALWSTYSAPEKGRLEFYQSKFPLFDKAKLTFTRTLEVNGVQISAYADKDNLYFKPSLTGNTGELLSLTYYLWEQDGIQYSAIFNGLDDYHKEHLNALSVAPPE
ncbi:M56 family metallopeptidase [Paenibacillus herberti]|uniref:Peptidase M56 domain-containing protein n=1 Tax=Paenibacillus herberti TaxID=1619309 RepID=A0A229NX94_9BACL|nr:M56 family metallopeptidase [Paenibacillus herberti]OXM14437.1 hypothetical protein CGZ75_15955 [Paenibacillus herberti]